MPVINIMMDKHPQENFVWNLFMQEHSTITVSYTHLDMVMDTAMAMVMEKDMVMAMEEDMAMDTAMAMVMEKRSTEEDSEGTGKQKKRKLPMLKKKTNHKGVIAICCTIFV